MSKPTPSRPRQAKPLRSQGFVLVRDAFARISAVEGIALTPELRETLERFDNDGLTPEERRSYILARFKQPAR